MVEYQSTPDFYNEYISHHGILGQKWGKQNGPPYPLGSDVSTGSRLKSGDKGSVKKKSYKNRPDNLSELNLKKSKKETKKELKDVQKDLRKVAPELNSYFLKSKEGKDYQKYEEETGSFDKEYMYKKMNDLASKDDHFKDLYETYNSLDKRRYDLEMQLIKKKDDYWYHEVEFDKNGKIVNEESKNLPSENKKPTLTTAQMIDNASKKGLEEHAKRKQNAINDNQDMFNDMLYNNRYGNNKKEDNKAYQKEIARVAKEYGITKQALQKEVEANFNQREKEIANKKYWESLKPDSKAQMNKMLNEAKKTDRYPIYFLEVTQNSPWVESHIEGKISDSAYKNKMFQEYKKYLEDPEKYVKSV